MKRDYVLIWPKCSKAWPSTYSELKNVKWESDVSEADKIVVSDYYRKSTHRVGTINDCSSSIFFEKSLFEVLENYKTEYHKRDLPKKSRLDFKRKSGKNTIEIGMDGYYLRFKNHRPTKEQTVIDMDKTQYEQVGNYEYDVKKIVLHEETYQDMTSKFDLFKPIPIFLEGSLMIKREILEKFISMGATGFAWCEIDDYTTELYEKLRHDETVIEQPKNKDNESKNDYIFIWPKNSQTWPSTYIIEEKTKWESDGSDAAKAVISDYYRRSAKQLGDYHNCSGENFFTKEIFELIKNYRIDYAEDDGEKDLIKTRVEFTRKAGKKLVDLSMDGYFFECEYHDPDEESIFDYEKSEFNEKIVSDFNVKKLVLNEKNFKKMTDNYDIFQPADDFIYNVLVVKREILNILLEKRVTGLAWCEIEDYSSELYKKLEEDESLLNQPKEEAIELDKVDTNVPLTHEKKLKSYGINLYLKADSEESIKYFQENYKGKKRQNLLTKLYENLLDDSISCDTIFQHHLNEEGDFSDEVHSDDWSDDKQKELISKHLDILKYTLFIVKNRIFKVDIDFCLFNVSADVTEDLDLIDVIVE